MAGKNSGNDIRCSFCNKTQSQVRKLIAGPAGVYICDECIDICADILEEELPGADVAVLSGPSHAEEVSRGLPTLCVAGSRKKNVAEYVQSTFISPVFRVYTLSLIHI